MSCLLCPNKCFWTFPSSHVCRDDKVVLRNDKVVLRNDKVVLRTDKVVHLILLFLSIWHSPLLRRHGQRKFQCFSK